MASGGSAFGAEPDRVPGLTVFGRDVACKLRPHELATQAVAVLYVLLDRIGVAAAGEDLCYIAAAFSEVVKKVPQAKLDSHPKSGV
jgi:hypothetical protein